MRIPFGACLPNGIRHFDLPGLKRGYLSLNSANKAFIFAKYIAIYPEMKPKAKSKGQLAHELGFSESTLRRRLREVKFPKTGRLLSPREQLFIYEALGYPPPAWAAIVVDKEEDFEQNPDGLEADDVP